MSGWRVYDQTAFGSFRRGKAFKRICEFGGRHGAERRGGGGGGVVDRILVGAGGERRRRRYGVGERRQERVFRFGRRRAGRRRGCVVILEGTHKGHRVGGW